MKHLVTTAILLLISLISISQSTQKTIAIKFDAKISSVEEVGAKISVVKVTLVRNNIPIDSTVTQNGRCSFVLDSGYVYKIYFSKKSYVSKHLLVSTKDLPETYPSKSSIKVDVSLFNSKPGVDYSFLEQKPIGIATYNFISKKIQWDTEYTRIMIDKIIQISIENYDKKNKD